ncbi:unnamed protein product [Penicillium salamii]|uniref:Arrestin-like N-terminal domain-containing protein n=1 Tax=Penicillium salamii TaxID=1612424 RepID=A0A9W4IT49_9EURO|nr:unnamed protein product [Penicillium salamii]CAG8202449.1 unnamed protein product [Penicillium salamii]CAG8355760.1 unnamed protein product [Penicillium salamii]CAG8364234.1 unnamed protein product [Penicillium salamii]CAG8394812.1 unnamed protein product [Penicillium salamii]
MSAATSILSSGSEKLDAWTRRAQPKVEIDLAGQNPGRVNSYTTGESVEGVVSITAEHDTRFEEIEIVLEGRSRTTVERASCPGRTGSQQMFLKLRQPIEDDEYPTPRVLEGGRSYQFPFTFVVPDRLLPQVCSHTKQNAHVGRSHTMLPPTLGDPMLASDGKTLIDDMAPDMSQVAYIIRASLHQKRHDGQTAKSIAGVAKKVRIIPVVEEEPPVEISELSSLCLRKEKTVKRGTLRSTLGRLVAGTSQPKPIQLLPPSCEPSDTVSTVTTVNLRFDPVGNEQPPPLGTMTSKLRSSTFYSASPWEDFPHGTGVPFSQVGRGLYSEAVPLSTMCVASAQWTKHTPDSRRDSADSASSSDSSSTGPSSTFAGDTYYTASIVIPITLPKNKTYVPTFHSCLISRTYSLELSLTYHTPAANIMTPTVSLRVPIQFTSQNFSESIKSSLGLVVTQEELDEFFQPRNVTSPTNFHDPPVSDVVIELAPPGYSETVGVATR